MLPSTPWPPAGAACSAGECAGADHVSTVAAAIQGATDEAVDVAFVDDERTAAGSADAAATQDVGLAVVTLPEANRWPTGWRPTPRPGMAVG